MACEQSTAVEQLMGPPPLPAGSDQAEPFQARVPESLPATHCVGETHDTPTTVDDSPRWVVLTGVQEVPFQVE